MNDKQIQAVYDLIAKMHATHLAKLGVVLPKLRSSNGKYTKDALVLCALAKNYPNTQIVSKEQLTTFVRSFYPDVIDVQQARHLSMQKGFYIVSGTRGDNELKVPAGSYKLITLETSYPAFRQDRRVGFSCASFDKLKKQYGNRCATCGSLEGCGHLFRKDVKVQLQKGHMNPSKPLVARNIIPQCQICNRADRNRWVYDKTGRVTEVAETNDGIRIVKTFLQNASDTTRRTVFIFLKKLLGVK